MIVKNAYGRLGIEEQNLVREAIQIINRTTFFQKVVTERQVVMLQHSRAVDASQESKDTFMAQAVAFGEVELLIKDLSELDSSKREQ